MPTVVKNAEVALTSVVNATLIGLFLFVVELAKERQFWNKCPCLQAFLVNIFVPKLANV
jgi:hypothetical protein